MKSINPANEELLAEYVPLRAEERDARIAESACAFETWKQTGLGERARLLRQAAAQLRRAKTELARLMTKEMGKPIQEAEAEIEKCIWVCEYYADEGEALLVPSHTTTDAQRSYVRFDPLGPILAVMPWNFPLWQVFRFAAPALMAGNAVLLKHASNVCGCALAIERVFRAAEFPPAVFLTLLISAKEVADVVAHPAVRGITLTGSERAGRSIAEAAGRHLKKTVLELGGSDPFLVLADADVEAAANAAARARMQNCGQSCIAAKRFIVDQTIAEPFEEALVAELKKLRLGDPLKDTTDLGPLARDDLRQQLHQQVQRSLERGAKLRIGGQAVNPGYFYQPTVLSRVQPGMPAFDEETFGPVAAVIQARGDDEAVELANRSDYGLGASVWTGDRERAERLAPRLETGMVFVNEIVKSDPRLPFGGVKHSGYGRELGDVGIHEFVNIKSVWVA